LIKTIKHKDGTTTEIDGSEFLIKKNDNKNSNMINNETKKIKIQEENE